VLAVCTGNVCRSPAVERLLTTALAGDPVNPQVIVTSRGTHALAGHPVSPPMGELLRSVGAPADDFVAAQVTAADINEADVVLTATRAHRSVVVSMSPAVVRRAFTVLEFAQLAAHVPRGSLPGDDVADRLRALALQAPSFRAAAQPAGTDLEDPWGQPDAVYRYCFDRIFGAVLTVVDSVVG
jgi:protein-tyrosine phosphatase